MPVNVFYETLNFTTLDRIAFQPEIDCNYWKLNYFLFSFNFRSTSSSTSQIFRPHLSSKTGTRSEVFQYLNTLTISLMPLNVCLWNIEFQNSWSNCISTWNWLLLLKIKLFFIFLQFQIDLFKYLDLIFLQKLEHDLRFFNI